MESINSLLKKQGYKIIGSHSAVKPCTWLRKSLLGRGVCYKEAFYGINSHRCLQCTPAINACTHECIFCWRNAEFIKQELENIDEPKEIVSGMLKAQKEFMTGYLGEEIVDKKKLEEAMTPKHAAISLVGEPLLYPKMSELLDEFHKRGMTTFVVTNGTLPSALKNLKTLPTQLYITLPAPDRETYLKTCMPKKDYWDDIIKSLKIMKTLKTRKVVRLTLVKEVNMLKPKEYSKLALLAAPHFIECKAFMSVGSSRKRLPYEAMPFHNEIMNFSKELAQSIGWKIIDENKRSRVALLAKEDYPWRKELRQNLSFPY